MIQRIAVGHRRRGQVDDVRDLAETGRTIRGWIREAPLPEAVVAAVEEAYVVDIKRSARRASAGAGQWVRDEGRIREFDSKDDARRWAAGLDGDRTVWIQDAVPHDSSGVDGYLVARRYDPERSRAREQTAATAQTPLGNRE